MKPNKSAKISVYVLLIVQALEKRTSDKCDKNVCFRNAKLPKAGESAPWPSSDKTFAVNRRSGQPGKTTNSMAFFKANGLRKETAVRINFPLPASLLAEGSHLPGTVSSIITCGTMDGKKAKSYRRPYI
jgi:hypothetical protein